MDHRQIADFNEANEAQSRIFYLRAVGWHLEDLAATAPSESRVVAVAGVDLLLVPSQAEIAAAHDVLNRLGIQLEQEYRQRQRLDDADIEEDGGP